MGSHRFWCSYKKSNLVYVCIYVCIYIYIDADNISSKTHGGASLVIHGSGFGLLTVGDTIFLSRQSRQWSCRMPGSIFSTSRGSYRSTISSSKITRLLLFFWFRRLGDQSRCTLFFMTLLFSYMIARSVLLDMFTKRQILRWTRLPLLLPIIQEKCYGPI